MKKQNKTDTERLTVAVKKLIRVVKSITNEQATCDHSGLDWGESVMGELEHIEKSLPKSNKTSKR